MRIIKFRAWSGKKEHGRYRYGMHSWEEIIESINDECGWRKSIFSIGTDPDSEMTLMQFTGLTDKNGVEIYEGDMFRYENGFTAPVIFAESGFKWNGRPLHRVNTYMEVIGNIYQNKNLLEVK